MSAASFEQPHADQRRFQPTRWSLVQAAGQGSTPAGRAALEELAQNYWYPLYAYLRRKGESAEDAADLVQGLFALLIERGDLESAQAERGRFRTWLLSSLRHYLLNERERAAALKRGGGTHTLSLDAEQARERYALEPRDELSPERLYDRRWALEVIARATSVVEHHYARRGKGELFEAIRPHLAGDGEAAPYAELALSLGGSEGALKVAVHRARKRFASALRAEIGETCADAAEVEVELAALFGASGR